MIISRTPFRISFFGGGTDYPGWYRTHGGAVLAASIDKYCYLTCRYLPPFFQHRLRVVYSKIELCENANQIAHPAVRAALNHLGIERGVEIHHDGDLPARSGMGSSSSFAVGLLHALHALRGEMASKEQLATQAIHLEQDVMRENVGSQDQVLAAYGGLNRVTFAPNDSFAVQPVVLPPNRLADFQRHLMLFYTGIIRTASDIASTYVADLHKKEETLHRLREMVDQGIAILSSEGDLAEFGHLLDAAWRAKRALSHAVSNDGVDAIYAAARSEGALGGKLLGAGGGGFMLLFVPPDRQEAVRHRLAQLLHVPFEFEHAGSQIIFYDPERDYADLDEHRRHMDLEAFRELAPSSL